MDPGSHQQQQAPQLQQRSSHSSSSSSSSSNSSGGPFRSNSNDHANAGYTFGLGAAYYANADSAPSPALSASASSYDGFESDFDTDLNALSLDDIDPDALPQQQQQQQQQSRRNTWQRESLKPTSSAPSSGHLDETEEEAQSEAESAAFDAEDEEEADMHAEGVPAAWGFKLDARSWEKSSFRASVLDLLSERLALAGWAAKDVHPTLQPLKAEHVHLKRISGALSNAVFFVSYKGPAKDDPAVPSPPTVLLRVYGSACELLLSRRAELLILHTLSSLYSIGPHILGTFANGRVEEFFDCVPIGKEGLRALGDRGGTLTGAGGKEAEIAASLHGKEGSAQWVARRMRELHEVPLDVMKTVLERGDLHAPGPKGFGRGIENHIMASSHRPRRNRGTHRPSTSVAPDRTPPGALQGLTSAPSKPRRQDSAAGHVDTSIATIVAQGFEDQADTSNPEGDGVASYLNIPPRPPLTSEGSGESYYVQGRNNSVASFDSLATSYNSHTSSWSGSEAASSALFSGRPTSPWPFTQTPDALSSSTAQTSYGSSVDGATSQQHAFTGFTSPRSPFMIANSSASTRSNGLSRSVSGLDAIQQHQRSPYPGVWRRMKRWSREAGKVIGLVDAFCSTPEGRAAAERALGHPLHELGTRAATWHSRDLGPTKGNLGNALRAIAAIDIASFVLQLDAYKDYVRLVERKEGQSKRVFAHNDSQYGNLLIKKSAQASSAQTKGGEGREKGLAKTEAGQKAASTDKPGQTGRDVARGMPRERSGSIVGPLSPTLGASRANSRSSSRTRREPPHHALVVIDFEYAAPNPRGFDIANHFQEWRTDYHHPTLSWSLTHHLPYPNESERRRWLRAYVEQGRFLRLRVGASKLPVPEAPSTVPASSASIKSPPKPLRKHSEIDDLEALPPPAVPVSEGAGTGPSPAPTASQEVQRKALEQSSGIRPGVSRNPSVARSNTGRVRDASDTTPPTTTAQSPPTPSLKSGATPSLGRTLSSQNAGGTGGAHGRTIKVANSPALQALYSPTLSPYIGPLSSLGDADGSGPVAPGGGSGAANEASAALAKLEASIEKEVDRIEHEVWLWGPACHALWALWGIVFAKEEIEQLLEDALNPDTGSAKPKDVKTIVEGEGSDVDTFDYLRYTLGRIELFRQETQSMNI
ncbi:hypothetical protein V8E36_005826 [Tilletia maclaganii]